MLQRAEWRPLHGDPDSPLDWWRRGLRTSVHLMASIATAILLLFAFAFFSGVFDALFLVPLVGALAGYGVQHRRRTRALLRLAALAPSPAPAECFPVEFTIWQGGVWTGRDQGIASFVDGWLHVEGLRTSFSLRHIDISKTEPLPDRDALAIPGGQRVELRSLGLNKEDRDTLRETLRVWYRFPFGLPRGEPLLPPLVVHPSAVARPLNTLFVHAVFAVPTVAFFVFFGRWPETLHVMPFLVPATVYGFRNARKAWTDLLRLKNIHLRALDGRGTDALTERAFHSV